MQIRNIFQKKDSDDPDLRRANGKNKNSITNRGKLPMAETIKPGMMITIPIAGFKKMYINKAASKNILVRNQIRAANFNLSFLIV